MTQIKNGMVLGALMALNELAAKDFTPKMAIRIRTMHRQIKSSWDIVEEVRTALIEKYSERDEAGEKVPGEKQDGQPTVLIAVENRPAFSEAWTELLDHTIEVTDKFTIEDFGNTPISAGVLLALGELVAD